MSIRNEFTKLATSMVGLGLLVGLAFPPFMVLLGVAKDEAMQLQVFVSSLGAGALLGTLNFVLARWQIGRRLNTLNAALQDLAEERVFVDVPCGQNTDVFGAMARALMALRDLIEKKRAFEENQSSVARRLEDSKTAEREALAKDFDDGVKGAMAGAQKDTRSLQDAARAMGESAESSFAQAHSAIELTDAAAQGVAAVAQSAETMANTVRELSARMRRSNEMAQEAVERVSQADALVDELSEATERIENVAELIIDIADKTNMLALNATIESARAGDAGKGFAVVAGEVKNLANQTAKATDEITAHINSIRGASERARAAMESVSGAIQEINTIASEVTRAAEEQNDTIAEISVNARGTAEATGQSLNFIREVGDAIEKTGFAAHEMLATVDDLARQMGTLAEKADTFVENVRKG